MEIKIKSPIVKSPRFNNNRPMRRIIKRSRMTIGLLSVGVFLGAAAPALHAQAGLFVANAIKNGVMHKISGGHQDLFQIPDNYKMMEVVPEPGPSSLLALGGAMGLAAWGLRRRSAQKGTSQHGRPQPIGR